jgi:hypothetical protein
MRILTLAALLIVVGSGCTSKDTIARHHDHDQVLAQRQAEYDAVKHIRDRLRTSRANDTITCSNKVMCEQAFSLTKDYIEQVGDMKIQFSDDTRVSTYNSSSSNPLNVSMSATKTPEIGETEKIKLVASCEYLNKGYDPQFVVCATKVADIYDGFKVFVESKL